MFKKKQTQVIRLTQEVCQGDLDDNQILFVRIDDVVTDPDALIEIPTTHNALVIKGGGDSRFYQGALHPFPVFDDKREIKAWKQGVSVQVVYMPKDTEPLVNWGTPTKVMYRDAASNKVIEIGARGDFTAAISNPDKFYRKIVGIKKEYTVEEFRMRMQSWVVSSFADIFLAVVDQLKLTYDQFDAYKKKIAAKMNEELSADLDEKWGCRVDNFNIIKIETDKADRDAIEQAAAEEKLKAEKEKEERERKLKETLAELERLDDKQWEREKYLKELEQRDKEAYYEVLKAIGGSPKEKGGKGAVFCPNCGHSCETTAAFCPHCGKRLGNVERTCPKCGKKIEGDAAFCSGCGTKL